MPGLIGVVRRDKSLASLAGAIAKLSHLPTYHSNEVRLSNAISLAWVMRQNHSDDYNWYFNDEFQAGALINGTVFLSTPEPRRLGAQAVLERYQQNGFADWADLDGAFIVVIVDVREHRLFICNDRLGCLPLYYVHTEDVFCFGPESKAVLEVGGIPARLSMEGIVTFLAAGYCLGARTLFERVTFLEPSTVLSFSLDTWIMKRNQIWQMQYKQDKSLDERHTGQEALYHAIVNAHNLLLCDHPNRYDLLLSGGLDSRGILGALDQLNRLPQRAIGYGLRDDIPYSDANVARTLAEKFHVPFHFVPYDTDAFPENVARWCYLSELANDNIGWYAETPSMLSELYDASADFAFIGDECWGWRGYAFTEMDTRAKVLPPCLPPVLHEILRKDLVHELESIYDQEICSITDRCDTDNWVDIKDHLYLYGRVARFIFSLGYYKEMYTDLRRPFLTNGVLDVISRLSPRHRVHKNLYTSMLRQYLPQTMSCPVQTISSLPDWDYDVRMKPFLRNHFSSLLDVDRIMDGPLGNLIDPSRSSLLINTFFEHQPHPIARSLPPKRWLKQTLWYRPLWPLASRSHAYARLMNTVRKNRPFQYVTEFDLLRRILLIQLLHDQLHQFTPSV